MAENPIGDMFASAFGGALDVGATVAVVSVVGVVLLGIIIYVFQYRRKFDIMVKIISDRASDPKVLFDKAGVFRDRKTKSKYLKLQKQRVELSLPTNFKILESTNRGDYLELYRKSEDEFVYLTQPKIDKEIVIKADGKSYPVARTKQKQFEGDIYWAIKRKEENKKMLDPESFLMKLLLYAPHILTGAFMFIILWIFMDKLPAIINNLTELTQELRSLKGATTP